MSLQAIFDEKTMNLFPKIIESIKAADKFSANQMRCYTLQSAGQSRGEGSYWYDADGIRKTLIKQDGTQDNALIKEHEENLLSIFKLKGWLK